MVALSSDLAHLVLRRLATAVRSRQLYTPAHPIVERNAEALTVSVATVLQLQPSLVIGLVGEELIVGDAPIEQAHAYAGLMSRLKQAGVERVIIDRGVTAEELALLVAAVNADAHSPQRSDLANLSHIRVGRVSVPPPSDLPGSDMAAFRQVYDDAVAAAHVVWQSAASERQIDATLAQELVKNLARAVSQNRPALLALTTLKDHDRYTFTHMVNVSILVMAQARSLGIDGSLMREFGLSALMHDIGKVRTPREILNKPDTLTHDERAIMQRHPVDGAAMLRATPSLPALAPIVAFEHHRRLDGSGYPDIQRAALNLATVLCSIADVYDAMRAQRIYQQALPADRILAVLQSNDGRFDQRLVRRFVQLVGVYPVGTLVQTDTGHVAVVRRVHAPDPSRPQVRVVTDDRGMPLERPYDVNLWERTHRDDQPRAAVAPVDPDVVAIDPLAMF